MDANGWIPVGERLPDKDPELHHTSVSVLVWVPENDYTFSWEGAANYDFNDGAWYDDFTDYPIGGVTHWQPLPPPPAEAA